MGLLDRFRNIPLVDSPEVSPARRHQARLLDRMIAKMRRKPGPVDDAKTMTVVEGLLSREGPRRRIVRLE